jgi:hypothetical protein
MLGSTFPFSADARHTVHRALTILLICVTACWPANPVLAQEPAETEECLPFCEDYSGAMLVNAYGTQLRVSHSQGDAVGRHDSVSSLELFHSIPTGGAIWFYEARLLLDNSAQFGGNLGVGYRR